MCLGGPADEFVKQRPADPSVSSPEVYQTAKRWISECVHSHEGCPKRDLKVLPPLPTRVIDVSKPGSANLRISEGDKGQYAALSYCWGSTRQTIATQNTLSSLMEGIETASFRKLYRMQSLPQENWAFPTSGSIRFASSKTVMKTNQSKSQKCLRSIRMRW